MEEYELIIFLADDKVFIMEVNYNGGSEIVGFQGEDCFSYTNIRDLDELYNDVCDKYSVNNLSELNVNVFFIDCGMNNDEKWYLIDKMRLCKSISINSISNLLPIYLSKNGLLVDEENIIVELLGKKYVCICDNYCHVESVTTGDEAQYKLSIVDFSFIAVWDGDISQRNSREILDLKNTIKEMKIENDKEKIACEEISKTWKNKYTQVNEKLNKMKHVINKRILITADVNQNHRIFKRLVDDNACVKSNQEVAGFQHILSEKEIHFKVHSPRAGKLALLPLDGEELPQGSNIIIGVVGDEDDDVEYMIEWAKTLADEVMRTRSDEWRNHFHEGW